MTASWSRPHVGSTEYKRGSRDCSRPMAGSPRIIARPTTRSRAACRRARVRQGQAFGGAEEAPSLTATARDGDGNVRSGWKNARGAGRTKEWSNNARQKWRDAPLTKKAPYKPYDGKRHVRPVLRIEERIAADRDLGIGLGDLAELHADVALARIRAHGFREHANGDLELRRDLIEQ